MSSLFGKTVPGNVVSMDRFRSGKSLSPIRQAEAYWCALRDGAAVPKRAQIDPRGLENILEYAFILERIAPGIARFRLAGNHLTELAGMEVRGMPLTSFFTPAARTQIGAVLEHMFDAPAVAELTLTGETRRGRAPLEARMILLPLEDEMGNVNRALGVLIADGDMGRKPNRFDLRTTGLRPVNGAVPCPQPELDLAPAPTPGFGEAQDPISRPNSAPHLRLVT